MLVKIEKDNERKLPLRPQSAQQAGEGPVTAGAIGSGSAALVG